MATWSKLFSNFVWKNKPDTSTPLGQTLLNRINTALNGVDDRVITLNAEKANLDDLNGSIVNVSLNENTGVFTFTKFDGTTLTINTALEEVVTNWNFNYDSQSLVLTLSDGTTQNVDLSSLITQYEFVNTPTVTFVITDGKVQAYIAPNSITDQMLQNNYLADITTQANTAVAASQSALESQVSAENDASVAETSADSALASAIRAEAAAERAEAVSGIDIATTEKVGIVKPDGTTITVDADGTIHGNASITVDDTLSTSSSNPIANKAVANAVEEINENVANITNGTTQVGNAKTLDGHGVEYFAPKTDLANYLPLTGGTVNGNVTFITEEALTRYLRLRNSKRQITHQIGEDGSYHLTDNTNTKYIIRSEVDGTTTFNGTASGNLAKSGGVIQGANDLLLTLKNTKSGATTEILQFAANDDALGGIGFYGAGVPIVSMPDGGYKKILHTGNKPTGTYTGNGSNASRQIEVGGIGNVLVVYSDNTMAIVGFGGWISVSGAEASIIGSTNSAYYSNGVFQCASAHVSLNANGVTYTYQVL